MVGPDKFTFETDRTRSTTVSSSFPFTSATAFAAGIATNGGFRNTEIDAKIGYLDQVLDI